MGHHLLIATLAMLRRIRYDFRCWPIPDDRGLIVFTIALGGEADVRPSDGVNLDHALKTALALDLSAWVMTHDGSVEAVFQGLPIMSEKGLTFANSSALRELRQFRFRRVWIYLLNLSQYEVGTVSKVILGTSGGSICAHETRKTAVQVTVQEALRLKFQQCRAAPQ